jgi:hypothetical protein
MSEDAVNLEIRKFLKQFGVAAQRAIEEAIRTHGGRGALKLRASLDIDARNGVHVQEQDLRIG